MDARTQASATSDGWVALALPYAASLALLVAPLPAQASLSRSALVLLPWIACAGLPRRSSSASPALDALRWSAFALPPAVVGARIDVLLGAPLERVVLTGLIALASVGLLAWAAWRAAGSRLHAASWGALVVAVPVLVGVCSAIAPGVAHDGPDDGGPLWTLAGTWAALSPLGWLWRRIGEDARAPYAWLETSLAGASLLCVCAVAVHASRSRAGAGA